MADDSDTQVSVSIGGKVDSSLQDAANVAKTAVGTLPPAAQDAEKIVSAASAAMASSFDRLAQEMQRTTLAVNLGFQRMAESAAQANSSMVATSGGAMAAVAGLNAVSHASTGVRREMIVLAHELAMGRFTRLGGSLMVMAERLDGASVAGRALQAVMSPTGLAIAAVAAATAGVIFYAEKGAQEMRSFANAMALTHEAAGLSAGAFSKMSEDMAKNANMGLGDAKKQLTALIATGRFTGDTLRLVGEDAVYLGRLTGEGTEKARSEFEHMTNDVVAFAKEHETSWGRITAAQMQEIIEAQRVGDTAKATKVYFESLHSYLESDGVSALTHYTSMLDRMIQGLAGAGEALKNFTKQRTAQDEATARQSQIDRLQGMGASGRAAMGIDPSELPRLIAEAKSWQEVADAQQRVAKASADAAEVSRKGALAVNELAEAHERARSSGEKLALALEHIKRIQQEADAANPQDKALHAQEAAEAEAEARRKDRVPKTPGAPNALQALQAQLAQELDSERALYGQREEVIRDFWTKAIAAHKLGGQQLNDAEKALHAANLAIAKSAYEAKLEDDRDEIASAKGSAAQIGAAYDKLLSDLKIHYAEDSREFEKAQTAKTEALKRAVETQISEMAKVSRAQEEETIKGLRTGSGTATKGLDVKETQVQDDMQEGLTSQKAGLAQLQAIEAQKLAIANQEAQAELAVVITKENAIRNASGASAEQIEESNKRVADEFQASQDRMTQAAQASADKIAQYQMAAARRMQQTWRTDISSVVDTFGSGMLSMARGTGTLQQAMLKVGESIENMFVSAIEKMVTNWIMQLVFGNTMAGAQQKVGALTAINDNAAVAASAAYAANIGVPLVGPEMAAAAASAAYAQVEIFSGLLSAAGGLDIGAGENPMAQLHAREMVLPANLSDGFRQIIADRQNAPATFQGGSGAGGVTNYNTTVQALDSRSVTRSMDNPRYVRAAGAAFRKHG